MLTKKLGKYEIATWLGGGRFGDVFLARDTLLDAQFALKISRMHQEEIAMLKDEARLLSSLNHQNIVRFYNIDVIDKKFVLVMEYVKGKTLRDIITDEGLHITKTLEIVEQILSAVVYAHEHNVLHRDLKPENILIAEGKKRVIKVTDFGLARFIKSGSLSASTAGTPIYMAPETWSGVFKEKSDVWSVAAIMYELLTGIPPFLADNLNALKTKIEKGAFLMPTVRRQEIPERVEDLLVQCLKTHTDARLTANEFLHKLMSKGRAVSANASVSLPVKEHDAIKATPAQCAAMNSTEGKVLLLGQAGCGKTMTLVQSVVRLLNSGTEPSRICVCTFTNKAANDIKHRVTKLKSFRHHDLWIGTFHTLGLRILRRYAERLNINENFMIREPKKIFVALNMCKGIHRTNAVIKFIEKCKANAVWPEAFTPTTDWENTCYDIYKKYQSFVEKNSILDYNDLIMYTVKLLEEYKDIRAFYRNKFNYLFVDELQDINPAQYRMITLLCGKHLFLTGDKDQAIYGWRGANKELIHKAQRDFSKIKTYYLTKSFRLPQRILDTANNLMLRDTTALPTDDTGDIIVYGAESEKDEAHYIITEIKNIIRRHFRYQDIALLYRTNALSRIYEESFIKARIPHTLIGGSSFYERSDIKPVIEYLELVEQTAEERTPNSSDIPRRTTQALALLGVKKRSTARFRKIVEYHLHNKQVLTPAHVIGDIVHATRIKGDNVDELLYLARGYTNITLSEFLSEIRLMQELDIADWGKDTVKLMTAHSAKGLEFPVVFIVDLIEDIFPLTKKMASKEEIEEERRLCYVAITRAKKKLYLLYPKRRYGRYQQPSRFLVDMFTTA